MKVKVKDEMDNIKIKANHLETILIKNALRCYLDDIGIERVYGNIKEDISDINNETFDRLELRGVDDLEITIKKMISEIDSKIKDIDVW